LAAAAVIGPRIGEGQPPNPSVPTGSTGPEPAAVLWALAFVAWAALSIGLLVTRRGKPPADDRTGR
ncbi:MAG TPA: hypothetical protein VHL09_10345, partial [Dehalococcoidia bacterium]|nr:hypothetical protein [Dehalococcoidia bacterium]